MALYQADLTDRHAPDLLARTQTDFARELVEGVERDRGEIDALIAHHSEGWTLDRIAPLERNILRVSLHELLHREDIPAEVSIDEAVEAAKELCGSDAPGFVNGVLGAVHRDMAAAK